MTAPTHQLTGVLFGLLTMTGLNLFGLINGQLEHIIVFFFFLLFGSLLPDLDTPKSKLGRRFPFFLLSYPLYWLFGHRTWTHSLMFVGISFVLSLVIWVLFPLPFYVVLGLPIGVLSHVLGDYCFDSGVPLFYPFLKRRFQFVVTAQTSRRGR
ncbi:metal-dependent hydrolase [Geomicrobium sp. JCM 19055]|uniref:metal-dependent hydrolase n=1 Tax=Geomicrobium sp. JCM 19055 TaxID=1460649 RepID=UPI000694C3C6|nr:metal-dependent hydrolase [Geomicrobium sp. JCM 19055]